MGVSGYCGSLTNEYIKWEIDTCRYFVIMQLDNLKQPLSVPLMQMYGRNQEGESYVTKAVTAA